MCLHQGFHRMDFRRYCGRNHTHRYARTCELQRGQGEDKQDEDAAHGLGAAGIEEQALTRSACQF